MKILRITLAVILCWPVFIIAFLGILVYSFFRLLGLEKLGNKCSYALYRVVCAWLLWALGTKIIISGRENLPPEDEAVVYTPNHCSIMDVPLIYLALHRFPAMMAKKELFKVPLVHGLLLSLKCVRIDRKSAHGALQAVHQGMDKVKSGASLVVFPEGTRSKTGVIGSFKSGAFRIASEAGARIVPVMIKNDRYCFEGSFNLRRVPLYITFLPPVETAGLDKDGLKVLMENVEQSVKEEYGKYPLFKA